MTIECTFCGCDVTRHDPVYVEEARDGERSPAGRFCNYACLAQYITAEGLETGTVCRIEPA